MNCVHCTCLIHVGQESGYPLYLPHRAGCEDEGRQRCCGRCLSCEVTVTCQSSLWRWGDRKLPSDINRMPKERDRHASGQMVWQG